MNAMRFRRVHVQRLTCAETWESPFVCAAITPCYKCVWKTSSGKNPWATLTGNSQWIQENKILSGHLLVTSGNVIRKSVRHHWSIPCKYLKPVGSVGLQWFVHFPRVFLIFPQPATAVDIMYEMVFFFSVGVFPAGCQVWPDALRHIQGHTSSCSSLLWFGALSGVSGLPVPPRTTPSNSSMHGKSWITRVFN